MPSHLSVDNLRVHDQHVTYTHRRRDMPPPPPPESANLSIVVPKPVARAVVKSTTTKASSVKADKPSKPAAPSATPSSKPPKRVEVHAEAWVTGSPKLSPSGAAAIKSAHAASIKSANAASVKSANAASVKSAHAASVKSAQAASVKSNKWDLPPAAPAEMALALVTGPIPAPPGSVKSSASKTSSAKNKGMEMVKATASVKGSPSVVASVAGSKAASVSSNKSKGKAVADEAMTVTVEETFTRKIHIPLVKGEKLKYGLRSGDIGGTRGFFVGK